MKPLVRFSRPARIALATVYTLLGLYICLHLPYTSWWTAIFVGAIWGQGVGVWQKALRV